MATLEINRSSSACVDCRDAGRYSSASPEEAGHYTCLGWNEKLYGTAGCQQKWDKIQINYTVDKPKAEMVASWKERWPHLRLVPDEDWQVLSWADVGTI